MIGQNITNAMQERSNEELYEIIAYAEDGDYIPEAILAAKKELESRNLDNDTLHAISEHVKAQRELKKERAKEPLSWPARIAFFIFSGGILIVILIFISYSMESKGYKRKGSESRTTSFWGFIFWCVIAFMIFKGYKR